MLPDPSGVARQRVHFASSATFAPHGWLAVVNALPPAADSDAEHTDDSIIDTTLMAGLGRGSWDRAALAVGCWFGKAPQGGRQAPRVHLVQQAKQKESPESQKGLLMRPVLKLSKS